MFLSTTITSVMYATINFSKNISFTLWSTYSQLTLKAAPMKIQMLKIWLNSGKLKESPHPKSVVIMREARENSMEWMIVFRGLERPQVFVGPATE